MENALLEKAIKTPHNEKVTFAELILASIDYEEDGILTSMDHESQGSYESRQ